VCVTEKNVYVHENFLQTSPDGNCMFEAVWQQLQFDDIVEGTAPSHTQGEGMLYTPYRLRLQLIYGLMKMVQVTC